MELHADAVIVVVGAGAMGAGVAQVAAAAGHPVRVIDRDEAALARGREAIEASLAGLVRRGRLDEGARTAVAGRIAWTSDLDAAADAALAIEAIVERLDAKLALFAHLAAIAPADAILATNTSSLSIETLAQAVPGSQRFIGLHFFNPVPAMRLVEVISGSRTDPQVAQAAFDLMRRWGKHPVRVRDVPGFIVNRVARPYYAEGFAALDEGLAAVAIDHALTAAGGFRMGPLVLADLIGHDVNYAVARSVYDAYAGRTRFRPQRAQQVLFEAGKLGRKTGAGVYDHGAEPPLPDLAAAGPVPVLIEASGVDGDLAPLIAAAREAGLGVAANAALAADTLVVDGVRIALGDGRSLARRSDVDVLLDLARDFATASTLVMTATDARSAAVAAGFAQALGRGALFIADRPGQVVLRTLLQLANAAADAVVDEVASAEAIDEAMVLGANHPQGPLAWSFRHGPVRVAEALANIAGETGDVMYRPAAYFAACPPG